MATDNRVRVRVRPDYADSIERFAEDEGMDEPDAQRKIIEEGLASLGYVDRPTARHELLLWYARKIGLLLGFVGLILIGYGIFGARLFSIVGFAVLLSGFVFLSTEEFLKWATDRYDADNGGVASRE